MNIDICIITYNRPDHLLNLLENINLQQNKTEILNSVVIINNASTICYSEVKKQIHRFDYRINYIDSSENLGVAKGRNLALSHCFADIILTIDDDAEFKNNNILDLIINKFSSPLFKDQNIGALCFQVFYKKSGNLQKNAFPHKKFDKYKTHDFFYTNYFIGCGHAILKKVYKESGPYPTDFFYGMEEYDLSYRIIDLGYKIAYTQDVQILHDEYEGGRIPSLDKARMLWYNKSKVAYRYLPIPYFFSTAILWSWYFLKNTKFNLSVFFSTWFKILTIPKTENRQKTIQPSTLKYIKDVEGRMWY